MNATKKIVSEDELLKEISRLRKKGGKIGITNGAFDILHAGHVRFLQKAKAACDALIVAVNSDESVRSYKGRERPIMPERERAEVVAALVPVDYVVIFSDRRMQRLLERLRPDLYIKGGDYKPEELTSRAYVEKHGGKAVILPLEGTFSTTAIINRIRGDKNAGKPVKERRERNKAVFLDRDGTIAEEVEYLHEPEKLRLFPNTGKALRKLQELGFKLVVITSQPGIGLGYYQKEGFFRVSKEMLRRLSAENVLIDKVYFCPHTKADKCRCRKPGDALFRRAEQELDLDLHSSFAIGDQTADTMAAKSIGCKSILVKTGQAGNDGNYKVRPDFVAADVLEAATLIEKSTKNKRW